MSLLKVIGTDTDRSATYDFLLTFHKNCGPISYRFRDRRRFQSKISTLAMRMPGTTWPVSGGCKIITYLESQSCSFILTVQLSSRYDDDKGRLLFSVKRFQTEKNPRAGPGELIYSVNFHSNARTIWSRASVFGILTHHGGACWQRVSHDFQPKGAGPSVPNFWRTLYVHVWSIE